MERRKPFFRRQARKIIFNVSQFMKKEAEDGLQFNIKASQRRAAAATGVSERTIRRVCLEEANNIVHHTPAKKKTIKRNITGINNIDQGIIKSCIHNFYNIEHDMPTIDQLLTKVKERVNFRGSATSFRSILKDQGFRWMRTGDKRRVIIEKMEIRLQRIEYLKNINKYRSQGRPIIYTDEIYFDSTCLSFSDASTNDSKNNISKEARNLVMLAGSEAGFLSDTLFMFKARPKSGCDDLKNYENYEKWIQTHLLPKLPPHSVIVIGNDSYHNKQVDPPPNCYSKKVEMESWLLDKGIPFDSVMLKPQLYKLICLFRPRFEKYSIDQIFKEHNHSVLRVPPFHADLNPIKLAWPAIKHHVVMKNVSFDSDGVMEMICDKIRLIEEKQWSGMCAETLKIEEDYTHSDVIIDMLTDQLVSKVPENESEIELDVNTDIDMSEDSGEDSDLESAEEKPVINHQELIYVESLPKVFQYNND